MRCHGKENALSGPRTPDCRNGGPGKRVPMRSQPTLTCGFITFCKQQHLKAALNFDVMNIRWRWNIVIYAVLMCSCVCSLVVMWSETVRLRTRPVWDQKKSVMVLVLQVWCCVVKHGLVMLVIIMILKDTATFQVLFIVSLFCAWNITTVEINSGVHLLKS